MCVQLKTSGFEAFGISYTQPISNGLGFGGEVYISPFQDKGRLKFMGRADSDDKKDSVLGTFTTGMGPDQLSIGYLRKFTPSLNFLAVSDFSFDQTAKTGTKLTSVLKVGYQFKSELPGTPVARALLDTSGNVACVLEDAFSETMQLTVTAKMNYFKNLYDFGFGILVSI